MCQFLQHFADAATEVGPGFLILCLVMLVAMTVTLLFFLLHYGRRDRLYRDYIRRRLQALRDRIKRRRR